MQGVVIDRRVEKIPGLEVLNYVQHGKSQLKLKPGEDMRNRRTRWVRGIVWHTTKGVPTRVVAGRGKDTKLEERIARLWATDGRNAGAHLSVDWDCTVGCHADLLRDTAYHAPPANEVTIGIELYEGRDGTVYQDQIFTAVELTEWLCVRFGIQRQMPPVRVKVPIPRLAKGGKDFVGVYGHRHVGNRGPGDPGDDIFYALKDAGFQEYELTNPHQDKTFWKLRQKEYGLVVDGVPGPITCDALREAGYAGGIWRPRADEFECNCGAEIDHEESCAVWRNR